MAQARVSTDNPRLPLALIAFIFLFLASTTIMVILLVQRSKVVQNMQQAQDSATQARQQANTASNDKQQVMEYVATDPQAGFDEVKTRIDSIVQTASGRLGDTQLQGTPLATVLERLSDAVANRNQQLREAIGTVSTLESDKQQLIRERDALQQQFKLTMDQHQQDIANIRDKMAQLEADFKRDFAQFRQTINAKDAQREQLVQQYEQQVAEAEQTILQQKEVIANHLETIRQLKPDDYSADILARQPDGRIISAVPGDDVVYINLGREDHVGLGMTFQVYSPTKGINSTGQGKATVEIVHVNQSTAECKITAADPGNPVVEGDLIANVAYDRDRAYRFYVAGSFDLDNDNIYRAGDNEKVRALITSSGSHVSDTLGGSTDFVVLGAAPDLMSKPGPNASQLEIDRYERAQKQSENYEQIRQQAVGLSIPIMSQEQFLAFMGIGDTLQLASISTR